MTLGGTIYGTTNNAFIQSAIDWYYESSVEKNSTVILAKLYYRRTNTGYVTGGTGSFTITINGKTVTKSGVSLEISTGWVEAMSASVEVLHNADGTKSVAISATGSLPPSSLTSTNCGGTVALPTIPRASTITCTEVNVEKNPTITIHRASPNFTHSISYHFGTLRGTVVDETAATSITSWTIPYEFYTQIPDSKRGYGALICTTYNGGSPIGTSQCQFYVSTDETICKPTVLGDVVDINPRTVDVTGDAENVLVRFCSTASCTMTASLNKEAGSFVAKTINNISATDGKLDIENVETGTFDFYAKDSRWYSNSDKVVKTLVPYIKLTNDATVYRDEPTSGNATLKIEGNYYPGSFGKVNNHLTVTYKQGDGDYVTVTPTISDNKYSATVPLTGLDYTRSFDFEVIVEDALTTIPKPLTLLKGIPVFDWGENDFSFNVPVTINGVNILEKLSELESLISNQ